MAKNSSEKPKNGKVIQPKVWSDEELSKVADDLLLSAMGMGFDLMASVDETKENLVAAGESPEDAEYAVNKVYPVVEELYELLRKEYTRLKVGSLIGRNWKL